MKAVVLARGLGRRMQRSDAGHDAALTNAQRESAAAGLKAMMPMAGGRPFLDYVISALADAGCTEVGLVLAPGADQDPIRDRYRGPAAPTRVRMAFLEQREALGTADAIVSVQGWVQDEEFLVVNADNLYPPATLRAMVSLAGPGLPVFERDELIRSSNIPAERIADFAILEVDRTGILARIVEKPGLDAARAAGPHALVSMNCWRFDARIFDACRDVERSPRGEFELPMAVGLAITRGVKFRAIKASGAVLDLSSRADVPEVVRRLQGVEPRL